MSNLKKMLAAKAAEPSVAKEPLKGWMGSVRAYVARTEPWRQCPPESATPEEFADWLAEIGVI